jgi:hypothetical protein
VPSFSSTYGPKDNSSMKKNLERAQQTHRRESGTNGTYVHANPQPQRSGHASFVPPTHYPFLPVYTLSQPHAHSTPTSTNVTLSHLQSDIFQVRQQLRIDFLSNLITNERSQLLFGNFLRHAKMTHAPP